VTAPHIVVDARLAHASGHRTYIRNLVPRLARLTPIWRWSLLGDEARLREEDWVRESKLPIIACDADIYGVREQLEVPWRVPRDTSLFWATHYNVPLAVRSPVVVKIHDVAHLRLPEYTSHLLRRAYARTMVGAALRRAREVICDSAFTRDELVALFGPRAGRRATVIHLGIDEGWYRPGEATPRVAPPYFVFVGNLKPHKNARTLVAAYRSIAGVVAERLVIVGKVDDLRTPDRALLQDIQELGDRVVMVGELPDPELRAVVRHATALVLPSLHEGFGFPPLEAMAAGCPAIVSRSGSLPEVCGDAATYVDAMDRHGLADALRVMSGDLASRRRMADRGIQHARTFRWDVSAERTLAVLRRALDHGAGNAARS
jgi:glycosyltransferase involved in cell wall biosynthesis